MRAAALLLALLLPFGACADEPADPPVPGPTPSPSSAPTGTGEPSAELASVTDDALRVTPPLEAYFFSGDHAVTVDEAVAALAEAGQELSPGNTVGGYVYDEADQDFRLCVEGPTGAFATYDTSPMSLFETGESGGCPD